MKKIGFSCLLLSGSLISWAQNVGIGTATPRTTLHVQGDLQIHAHYTSTKSEPAPSRNITLRPFGSTGTAEGDSVVRVYDPGGPSGNYEPSQAPVFFMNPNYLSGAHIELLIENIDLGSGDSIFVYTAGAATQLIFKAGNGYKATNIPITVPASGCRIDFKSNADAEVGSGFSILVLRKYIDASRPDIPLLPGRHGLAYHSKKSALRSGTELTGEIGENSTAFGFGSLASGENSFAAGFNSAALGDHSFSAGWGTVATGFSAIALGRYNDTANVIDPLFVIGNGSSAFRRNAVVVNGNGSIDLNGFTRLGTIAQNAPRIQMKKITATGPAINGSIAINHGLTAAKILQVSVLMEYGLGAGETIPPNYTTAAGYQYDWQVRTNDIFIINRSGNSANIGNRPVRILITYEE